MELDLTLIMLFVLTGLGAGIIDAIAGGGGMITLPVLLASGMSPVEALATNKLQGSFGTFAASVYFVRKKLVDLTQMKLMILCTFLGAVCGTVTVQQLDTTLLASLIFFALGGNILWLAGFTMAAGQLIGGQIGAHMVVNQGARLIRPLVVVVTLIMSVKLLLDQ